MFHGKRFGCAPPAYSFVGVGGRRSIFQRCVEVGFVEAEGENMRRRALCLAAGN
jgi:hypothetical protein